VDLAAIYSLITDDMREVDAVIRARLRSEVVLVSQVAEYIIGAGGKRMRPALVLLVAGALGLICAAVAKPPMHSLAMPPAFWSAIFSIRAPSR
jgi:geranylgeranyl pyrophosphate synthase